MGGVSPIHDFHCFHVSSQKSFVLDTCNSVYSAFIGKKKTVKPAQSHTILKSVLYIVLNQSAKPSGTVYSFILS